MKLARVFPLVVAIVAAGCSSDDSGRSVPTAVASAPTATADVLGTMTATYTLSEEPTLGNAVSLGAVVQDELRSELTDARVRIDGRLMIVEIAGISQRTGERLLGPAGPTSADSGDSPPFPFEITNIELDFVAS